MATKQILYIINCLAEMLLDENLHSVNYRFANLVPKIEEEKLKIEVVKCKTYYLIGDHLNSLLQNKIAAASFEEAAKFREQEIQYIIDKGWDRLTILKTEPSFITCNSNAIVCHLGNTKQEHLIANLIEAYLISTTKP